MEIGGDFSEKVFSHWYRIRWLNKQSPVNFPFCIEDLLDKISEVILPFILNDGFDWSWEELKWHEIFDYWLGQNGRQDLLAHAPAFFTTPAETQISIQYHGSFPVAAIKLQELFGLHETPLLGYGTSPLVIHLLSPASRPIQVTSDLKSFWSNTYAEVRKELKGRYIRHYWPENPHEAMPIQGSRLKRPPKPT